MHLQGAVNFLLQVAKNELLIVAKSKQVDNCLKVTVSVAAFIYAIQARQDSHTGPLIFKKADLCVTDRVFW